jgi:hypothetical protein
MDPDVVKEYPYDRYRTMDDGRVRPLHRSWNNIMLPHDNPWWNEHTPPNGWGCRCWKEPVNKKEHGDLADKGAKTTAPDDGIYEYKNPTTGEVTQEPRGIDPGWGYNPGRAAWGVPISEKIAEDWKATGETVWDRITPGDYKTAGRPEQVPLDEPKAAIGAMAKSIPECRSLIEKVIGGPEKIFSFAEGDFSHNLVVDAEVLAKHLELNRTPYLPLLPELLGDPFEIWMGFEKNKLTGQTALRQRIIKGFNVKGKALVGVFQANKGRIESWTMIPTTDLKYVNKQRQGKLIWKRD